MQQLSTEINRASVVDMFHVNLSLSYHYSLSCGTISADDCRSTTDHSCSQRSMDGVGMFGKLWMLLSDVLNHLSLRYKHTGC